MSGALEVGCLPSHTYAPQIRRDFLSRVSYLITMCIGGVRMAKLPGNVTIRSLMHNGLLHKPEEYIRNMWRNCLVFKKDHGAFRVRLGLSGTGQAPNYRIEFAVAPKEQPTSEEIGDFFAGRKSHPALDALVARNNAFSGRSHKISLTGLDHDNWSTATQDEEEILSLLQEFVDARRKE